MKSPTPSPPISITRQCHVAFAILAVASCLGCAETAIVEPEVVEAEQPSVRLRAILDPWLQNLNESDRDAWRADKVYAQRIADDASFDDALLTAEQERLYEAALDLEDNHEPTDSDEEIDLINRFDAFDLLWHALEDAKALRIEARRAPTAAARALRQRLDAWRDETSKTRLHQRTLDDATAALTYELVAGNATDEDLALELELERLRMGRLHSGPRRYYLVPKTRAAMLATIEALEQTISMRTALAVLAAPPDAALGTRAELEVAKAKTAGVRLRAILDPWLQSLTEVSDPDAWRASEVYARRIATDASFDEALLVAEQERLFEIALDLEDSHEHLDSDDLINIFYAYDFLWQALEDAKALRVEARRASTASAQALRQRLDAWRAETGETRLDERTLDEATAALTDELVASHATDEDLALELELERLQVGRLHAGPARSYPGSEVLVAMLATIEALEQAISMRASQTVSAVPGSGG